MKKEGRGPSTYLLEIEQLKSDNRKLIEMLQSTNKYKEFAGFMADSGGRVRAITSPIRAQSKQTTSRKKQMIVESPTIAQHRIVNGNLIHVEEDRDGGEPIYRQGSDPLPDSKRDWVPDDAFKAAHQFRQ